MKVESKPYGQQQKGPIAWMAGNTVAANLLMLVLLVGGLLVGFQIKQEVFPEFSLDRVSIVVGYPGASPEEVENGILLAVEEAVEGLEGVDEIRSTAREGSASVILEAIEGTDITRLWQEVKSEIDRVSTFPDEANEPQVAIAARQREVLNIGLFGRADEATLREAAELVRDELLLDPNITQVLLDGVRDYEIHIEVPQESLRRYNLTLQTVADTVARASVELGGGSLKTSGGDILVRVKDRRERAREYARLPVLSLADGSQVLLEDIATVREGFEDTNAWASYNGYQAVMIDVYRVGDQTPTQVAEAARAVLEQADDNLPQGLDLAVLRDRSVIFNDRAELLLKNAFIGLTLVFLFLAVFLDIRLAFWVSLGIPISILGSFLFLEPLSISINMITMFAFIVTLGIVVDDAVVVGENVYYYRRKGMPFLKAAIMGAREVALPVVFSVLTNMVAFLPLFFVPGIMGKIFKAIPVVVICVFGVSLIESLFILPSHLSHSSSRQAFWPLNHLERWQQRLSQFIERLIHRRYGMFLAVVLRHRYTIVALALALLMATVGYIKSGRMGMVLFPKVESDYAYCEAYLPFGTSQERMAAVEKQLVNAAERVAMENGQTRLSKGVLSQIKENRITVRFYLTDAKTRPLNTSQVTALWRDQVGVLSGLESITFESDRGGPGSGKGLTVQLSHRDIPVLDAAGETLAEKLAEFPIVHDIDDGSANGKRQFDIQIRPAGVRMGLTSKEVANQIRHAFQGVEAVKQQRGRNEITVRVRLPENERIRETTLEDLVLQAPGGEILLRDAVDMIPGRAYTAIERTNGRRVISVTANVRPPSKSENVKNTLNSEILPDLADQYAGLGYGFKGRQADIQESVSALIKGLGFALLGIYAMLAIPFKSYFQPMIIMFCIPFGMIGAVVGHLVMGYSLSVMSLFGIVALSGVVVNDSLILIDFANRRRRSGKAIMDAIQEASVQRFRPILLTTLTTFGGLAPMIMETSRQARFLIPMAISLGFGILFATFITLILVPSLYLILEDVKALFGYKDSTPVVEEMESVSSH
jgi:multidrug efflux pump subunit AcrB